MIQKNKHLVGSILIGTMVFIVLLVVLFSWIQSRESNDLKARNLKSMTVVSQMAEFIKFSIEKRVLLLKGYEVYLMTNPDISEEQTLAFLQNLIGDDPLINNIAIIQDSTIIFNYPKEENKSSIGVDLLKIPAQRDGFNKVKITLQPLFFGPVDLVQGGRGYIARTPLIMEGKYWGQVSIVLKAEAINELFKNYAAQLNLEITLFKELPSKDNIILGNAVILEQEPIIRTISIMGSRYVIAALEITGDEGAGSYMPLYILAFAFSFLLAFVVFLGLMKSNEIRVQASKDKLTQVHNRSHLDHFLRKTFNRVKNDGMKMGIVVMDIDDLKTINDKYGHLAGDAVLQALSTYLLSVCRKTETVFRMGGDEFLIVFEEIISRDTLEAIVERILSGIPSELKYKEFSISLRVSAGYSFYPEDGDDFDLLFKHADDQMYKNKRGKLRPKLDEKVK